MLIMHVISVLHHRMKCGCYGNGNSQIVAITYGSRHNLKLIQASFVKLDM